MADDEVLGELWANVETDLADLGKSPIHGRVLETPGPEGTTLVLCCWSDPGGAPALFSQLKPVLEATLLAELSEPARDRRPANERVARICLVCFEDIADVPAAVKNFGFRAVETKGEHVDATVAQLRGEAARTGRPVPDEPSSVWQADVAAGPDAEAWADTLAGVLEDEVFGQTPGLLFQRLGQLLASADRGALKPTLGGLDLVEENLVRREPAVLRWIPPVLFQALCDTVGVVAKEARGRVVQWAVSEPDDDGLAPPPLFRVREGSSWIHIPIGLHLLRWCVMPLADGEAVPRLSEWLTDQFN